MRDCQRNFRRIWYANPIGYEPVKDEYGNDTLEVKVQYSDQECLKCNISVNNGSEDPNDQGLMSDYVRTISISGNNCPLSEQALIWFNVSKKGPANYVVDRILDSKNCFRIGLREVAHGNSYTPHR